MYIFIMTETRKCSRCRSKSLLKYFAINKNGEHNKICETWLNKSKKRISTDTEHTAYSFDSELTNTAIQLLQTYSRKQLNQIMRSARQLHLMAYVEYILNKEETTTFRKMSYDDALPLIIAISNVANHVYSDGHDSD